MRCSTLRNGLDAVVVNPTTPVGDGDHKPTPTGRMIAGVASEIRGYVGTTGLNLVDVRDVARGHVLAHERGVSGERYLLGASILPLAGLFAAIADIAGRPRLPSGCRMPRLLRRRGSGWPTATVRLARLPMYFHRTRLRICSAIVQVR